MELNIGIMVGIGILSGLALLFSIVTLFVSILALSKVNGLERSTHSVQMIPVDEEIDKYNQDVVDSWATSDESLEKQRKLFREDLEEEMAEFAPSEEDKKIYSF